MEELPATPPHCKENNGRSSFTPKNRKKSPGDVLGSGKSQLPITRFYSPVSSSSDLSQLYSPIPCRSGAKRRLSEDLKLPNKKNKAAPVIRNHPTVDLSSDDSSDDISTQYRRVFSPLRSRVNFPVKKRLRPETSSPVTSTPARKKRLPKEIPRWSRILSDSESENEAPMENSRKDSKPLQMLPQSSQVASVMSGCAPSTSKLIQNHVPPQAQARRRLCLETPSQAVVITSSEDSDFELHNSKQSHSYFSQSACGKDATQCSKISSATVGGSPSVGNPLAGTQKSLKKRCSLGSSTDSASLDSRCKAGEEIPAKTYIDTFGRNVDYESMCNDVDGDGTESTGVEIGGVSSIYLQDTLPPSVSNGSSFQSDTDDTGHVGCKTPEGAAVKPGQQTVHQATGNTSSHQDAVHRAPSPPNPDSSSGSKSLEAGNMSMNDDDDDDDDESSDICDASSIYLHDTIPMTLPHGSSIQAVTVEANHPGGCRTLFSADREAPGHLPQTPCQSSADSPTRQAAVTPPPPGHSIYNEKTIDPVMHLEGTLDLDATDDICHQQLTNGELGTDASANTSQPTVPMCRSKGTIIEPSDEEDEAYCIETTKTAGANVGISQSELLNVSHISGSDFSGIVQSDGEVTLNDRSSEIFLEASDNLPTRMDALLVEDSDESSRGITSDSLLDTSADFFSDVISSLGTGGLSKGLEDGQCSRTNDSRVDPPPRAGMVSWLAGAGSEKCWGPRNAADAGANGTSDFNARALSVLQNDITATFCNTSPSDRADPDSLHGSVDAAPSIVEEDTEMTTADEMKVVCGVKPPESLAEIPSLRVSHLEQTVFRHPYRPMLLDAVISECQNYADHVMSQEPIKSFVLRYSYLPESSKTTLNACLVEMLDDSKRWLKYDHESSTSVATLVTSGIFKYLETNDELITKLDHLSFSELTDVLCKLGNSPSKSVATMKNVIVKKFSSAYTCERVRNEVTNAINGKFVRLTETAAFCVKICLELFALPLNLCDKFYKTVDIARYADGLIRDVSSNKLLLLPLKRTQMAVDPEVLRDLGELLRIKSRVLETELRDESVFDSVNDICSSIAVMEYSRETDSSIKNATTFRALMTTYVYALDDQLKSLLYRNSSDVDFGACVYLGVLLKQNVAGPQHKVRWCRERMKRLSKLLDPSKAFENFYTILQEPVSPAEFIVRSEFVSSSLKMKKLRLSPDQKTLLTALLRPLSHKKTHIPCVPLNNNFNHYSVLTKKPKGKNINTIRCNIFEHYKSDFPDGVEDNGALLFNAVFLTFWQWIYAQLDGVFVNKFQNCPLDWGSEEFFVKRRRRIEDMASEMKKYGMTAVVKLIENVFERFFAHRSVVDWQLVAPNVTKMLGIVEALGVERFLKISVYVLGRVDERVLGFPDVVLWNHKARTVKFLGLKRPADHLYPQQILWLEKLGAFGVDAEELIVSGCAGSEQCSLLK